MIPTSYGVPRENSSPVFARAFARGCHGRLVLGGNPFPDVSVAGFWSPALWPLLERAQRQGSEWWYGDHGYFRRLSRYQFYRITRNAYQHPGTGVSTGIRFQQFMRPIQPWRRQGTSILVCPQSAQYFSLFGLDLHQWIAEVRETLERYTDRPIQVRYKGHGTPIQADLRTAWAVVTYSSASALDALIEGVPVFVLAPFAAARCMGRNDLSQIEDPCYPEDRERFLSVLADNQWTIDEIARGDAWRALTSVN